MDTPADARRQAGRELGSPCATPRSPTSAGSARTTRTPGTPSEHLLVIADGVGGAARGDVASSDRRQALRRLDEPPAGDDLLEALAGAIHRTHDRIAELVEQNPELDGTSTTVTAALFDGTRIGVAPRRRQPRLPARATAPCPQLTKDHTFVQSLIDEGRITEDESRVHPHRNLILRAVDGVHEPEPDLFYIELAPGDRLLLCSDGCLRRARPTTGSPTSSAAARSTTPSVELIRASLEAGSSDNVTVVVADVVDPTVADDGTAAGRRVDGSDGRRRRRRAAASRGPASRASSAATAAATPARSSRSRATTAATPTSTPRSCATPRRRRAAVAGSRPARRARWCSRWSRRSPACVGYRWSQNQYYVAEHDGEASRSSAASRPTSPASTMNHVEEDDRRDDRGAAGLPDRAGPRRHLRRRP